MKSPHKTWRLAPQNPAAAQQLSFEANISPVVAQLLVNRGVTSGKAARSFLSPRLADLTAPEALPGLAGAVEVLAKAIKAQKLITIYGDYDVDGTTGTAILVSFLRALGVPAEFEIPNRQTNGYGLSVAAVERLARAGRQVVVTVDCGITASVPAKRARELGVTLVVTDHHEPQGDLPECEAVAHPRLPGHEPFANPNLSGAGVAFMLAWELAKRLTGRDRVGAELQEVLLGATALAALGLVADVMPLTGENRLLVHHGLRRLTDAPCEGMRALIRQCNLHEKACLLAEDIGFGLAPRLNAAGRLADANRVVRLLTTTDRIEATTIAGELDELNLRRQKLEREATNAAKELVQLHGYDDDPAIVLAGCGWHPGVVGIVASRVAEAFHRPTLIISTSGDAAVASGSGRTVGGFPLHEALAACGEHLESHGGHAAAAGFRVSVAKVEQLREAFNAYVQNYAADGLPEKVILADSELPLAALTRGVYADLEKLEPYGAGNARPMFLAADLEIVDHPRRMGKSMEHLSVKVRQGGTTARAVGWHMGERLDELMSQGGKCSLMLTASKNEWNGQTSIEGKIVDLRAGGVPELG